MVFNGEGALVLKKSKRIPKKVCLEFLSANMDWVLSHFRAIQDDVFYEDKMYCFGEWQEFSAVCSELEEAGILEKILKRIQKLMESKVKVESKSAQIQSLQNLWIGSIKAKDIRYKRVLEALYKGLLESYVKKRIEILTKAMNLYPSAIEFGKSYRQLGCCYAKTQKIRFSLRLSLMPKDCIDSVIIHELTHLKYQNHSKVFWDFVEKFDTNPKISQLWLDTHKENLRIYYKVFKY
ncbi:YgjP-like metallopeptidase domain-containing protein [Helicobacter turcicus]|uniref:M48 family metallopeptidase n=1 Tax=Helicobacter turcicus TaxID=2867412 RepID=A0ABS7JNB9_9HELI|nr:YgjP-like metallopeptidase domain-containing protein [Helicobacter turcicus]MBX7490880.1 M48 family metallopeptidase [Helicobacter turcicus]MBX7545734.1 M48 family metallopeptidase [Helicobacter turcicus]